MPIYEYECKACQTRFEKMQSITAEPLTECENCGGGPIRRVLHPVGVIFKGSGWYKTDSRKSSGTSDGSEAKSGTEAAASDKAEKASTEPANKSDAAPSTSSSDA